MPPIFLINILFVYCVVSFQNTSGEPHTLGCLGSTYSTWFYLHSAQRHLCFNFQSMNAESHTVRRTSCVHSVTSEMSTAVWLAIATIRARWVRQSKMLHRMLVKKKNILVFIKNITCRCGMQWNNSKKTKQIIHQDWEPSYFHKPDQYTLHTCQALICHSIGHLNFKLPWRHGRSALWLAGPGLRRESPLWDFPASVWRGLRVDESG